MPEPFRSLQIMLTGLVVALTVSAIAVWVAPIAALAITGFSVGVLASITWHIYTHSHGS